MKNKYLATIGFKNFIRDKKNIVSILLIGLMFALTLLCFSFKKSLNNYWNNTVKKLVDYRTYIVRFNNKKYDIDSVIEKIKSYNHVVDAFDEISYMISMRVMDTGIVNENNSIHLIGTISDPIKLIYGNDLNSVSLNENPIICAKQFYPFVEKYQKDYLTSKSIDITNKLGKNINLSFLTSTSLERFKIVGLYDAKANHTEGNVCYTKLDVVKKLNKKYQPDIFLEKNPYKNFVYMVIDNVDNENLVVQEMKKDGIEIIMPTLHINKELGNNVISLIFIVSGIIVVLSIALITYMSIKKINKRKKDYSVMKATGYSNSQITKIYIVELMLEFIFAFLCSILFYNIIIIIFQRLYISEKIMFYDLRIKINYIAMYLNLLLSSIICLIMTFFLRYKIKKW